MRVGIDARLVFYSQAGIGQYILHLIDGLAQIDHENEYDFCVRVLQSHRVQHFRQKRPVCRPVYIYVRQAHEP